MLVAEGPRIVPSPLRNPNPNPRRSIGGRLSLGTDIDPEAGNPFGAMLKAGGHIGAGGSSSTTREGALSAVAANIRALIETGINPLLDPRLAGGILSEAVARARWADEERGVAMKACEDLTLRLQQVRVCMFALIVFFPIDVSVDILLDLT